VRVGDWKLVRKGAAGPWELYDLARDRTEMNDLAAAQPEKAKALAATWEAWAQRCHVESGARVGAKAGGAGKKGK
jgi:arylsulfatase A-like enzyme